MRFLNKKIVFMASLISIMTTTTLAAPKDTYINIADSAVVMNETDTSIFKPAAIKSLDDYDEHYRLYKYDTISIKIIGYKDAQGLLRRLRETLLQEMKET